MGEVPAAALSDHPRQRAGVHHQRHCRYGPATLTVGACYTKSNCAAMSWDSMHKHSAGFRLILCIAVYGKSAAEDLEDQLRFEEGDDDEAANALAHDPLTLLSQPSPPVIVLPPSSPPPPPAVPAPRLIPGDVADASLGPGPTVTGRDGRPGSAGAGSVPPQLQPQPANPVQADAAQAAEPAVIQTAEPAAAASEVRQPVSSSAAAAAAAAESAARDPQHPAVNKPAVAGSAAQDAPSAGTGKHPQPAQLDAGRPDAASSTVAAEPAPDSGVASPDGSIARAAGNASAAAAAAVAAAAAHPAAALVPQVIPAKQPETEPRLLALNADDKQLQLQSSRLGKSVYDLLVQVPVACTALSTFGCLGSTPASLCSLYGIRCRWPSAVCIGQSNA